MDLNKKFVITINRQFGSGGHKIGSILAEKLNAKFLDKEILKAITQQFNTPEEAVDKLKSNRNSWNNEFVDLYKTHVREERGVFDKLESGEMRRIFNEQAEIIRQLADKESCVIVGRCAFSVFKEHQNALKIFVHSNDDIRIKRIVNKYNISPQDAKVMMVDNDCSRELYTKALTGTEWWDARNYDICLDVSNFGVSGAANYIVKLLKDE